VLAGANPVYVAAQGVDFTVVGDHAEGMREVPGGKGIGGKTLVHQRQRGNHALVTQIMEILADLVGQQHAFVDHGAGRHRGHIKHLAVGQLERLHAMAGFLADHIQLALQRVDIRDASAGTDEYLADHRLDFARSLGQAGIVAGDIAPAQQHLAFVAHRTLDSRLAGAAAFAVARQKHHADAVGAGGRQGHSLTGHLGTEEAVRNLDQDAGAVAEQRIVAGGAAMLEILEDLQALRDDSMAFLVLDVGNEANAAGVMFIGRIVETLALGEDHLVFPRKYERQKAGGSRQKSRGDTAPRP